MKKRIYLDNNATTPLDPTVLDAMIAELAALPHNPSSFHSFGQEGKKVLSQSRSTIANCLGVKSSEILFTSGGTEGLNLLIRGLDTRHIVTTAIEHAAIHHTVESLSAQVTTLPVDTHGAPYPTTLPAGATLLILSAVNSETGVKIDLETWASLAKRAGIPFIVDSVALLGKEPFTIPDGVTGMAFSAHKFHGPKGVGFIYLRTGTPLTPLITGGGQEKNLRGGTENLPAIVGVTRAIELLTEENPFPYLQSLRKLFESELLREIPDLEINGDGPRIANTSNLYFPGVEGESLLIALDMEGIAASHASACASGALEPSRILLGMGYSKERAASSLRFSFSRMNTPEEIKKATETVASLVKRLRMPFLQI
ncbi:cysteine desulfurase family protein [Candidatus Neptunochlamydia vexilliferae]|uniref:Cysteine desulfurase n=1 Tax=Candidatus Neptunichlamydia vexilliferae TaxID=1651774 RepID=A0ABS0AWY6_9BACT|nr:cysteine desulfurase family protein [Candidatus Neptunochlamydia vexilliferae]MBF5058631.1 Cysteine desulfurase [Candidatus Neptunochlamydia vexilliferae]